jgi:hypothetical protein
VSAGIAIARTAGSICGGFAGGADVLIDARDCTLGTDGCNVLKVWRWCAPL